MYVLLCTLLVVQFFPSIHTLVDVTSVTVKKIPDTVVFYYSVWYLFNCNTLYLDKWILGYHGYLNTWILGYMDIHFLWIDGDFFRSRSRSASQPGVHFFNWRKSKYQTKTDSDVQMLSIFKHVKI